MRGEFPGYCCCCWLLTVRNASLISETRRGRGDATSSFHFESRKWEKRSCGLLIQSGVVAWTEFKDVMRSHAGGNGVTNKQARWSLVFGKPYVRKLQSLKPLKCLVFYWISFCVCVQMKRLRSLNKLDLGQCLMLFFSIQQQLQKGDKFQIRMEIRLKSKGGFSWLLSTEW